jgi:hypothetical protein
MKQNIAQGQPGRRDQHGTDDQGTQPGAQPGAQSGAQSGAVVGVFGGVDTHLEFHVAAAVNALGALLAPKS